MRKPVKPDSREATRRDAIMAEWLRRVAQSPGLTLISFKAACDRGEVPGLHTRDFVEPIATPAEVVTAGGRVSHDPSAANSPSTLTF